MPIEIEIPRYTLTREIGSGGMAVVYLATQEGLDRPVAVKVLRKSLSSSGEEFRKRFEHEGRMLAQLEHENIVKIYDIGATENAVYMVMEYLRGGTLSQKMKAGELDTADVIKVCAQVGLALHAAHQKNIIHRDLKPSNIMFRDPLTPVLTDFGIARKIDQDLSLTATGMMIGTPQYMSPEQIQGRSVDARSDIYSLGLMFYRLLTGNLPFDATDPIALAMQQIQKTPPPLPDELSELQPVMDQLLAKDPKDRYQNMLDFCNHLRSISLTGEAYATELSTSTRVFSSAQMKEFSSLTGAETEKEKTTETSTASRAFSSISTAVSAVFTQRKPRNLLLASLLALVVGIYLATQFFSHGLSDSELRAVERELKRFNALVDLDRITSPVGENATESLQKLQGMAPEFGDVEEAAQVLADIYEGYAYDDYDDGKLDEARVWVGKGLQFLPQHDGLTELKENVEAKVAERDRLQKIEDLLAAGNAALASQNLLPPAGGNAYDLFQEVRTLDLQNEVAEAGLSEIQRQIEGQVRALWAEQGREQAKALAAQGLTFFSDSTLLLDLNAEIEREAQLELEQLEFNRLVALGQEQFGSGRLVEPAGDNALESYSRARELRPDDPAVTQGLNDIADHFLVTAKERFEAGEFQESLAAVAEGLKAMPDHAGLLEAQNEATTRLGAREREIQTRLQQAERLVASGKFIPGQAGSSPETENAFAAFNRVLEVDAENQAALDGLSGLRNEIDGAASTFQREGKLEEARGLLSAAQVHYQDDDRYSTRIAILDQKMAELAAQQQMDADLLALDRMMDQRPFTIELIDRIAASLREISGRFPDEVEVSERLSRFVTLIGDEADRISQGGDAATALAMLDHALIMYPTNARLSQALDGVRQREVDRAEQERQRIAAMSGVLAIDATPWARVIEVRNSMQELQELPASTDTPLFLTLLEGNYSVRVAAADGESQAELSVRVKRQEVVTGRPEIIQMNAKDYFEKSGW